MNMINISINLGNIDIITYILKIFCLLMCSYYTFLKISNNNSFLNFNLTIIAFFNCIIAVISGLLKYNFDSFTCILFMLISSGILYSIITKNKIEYALIVNTISISINYIMFFIAIFLGFIPTAFFYIQNDFISFGFILLFHIILLYLFFKVKKFKYGFAFLNKKLNNDFFEVLILNISVSTLFLFIVLNNYNLIFTSSLFFAFIIFAIIMFITIQKTLSMYYKHNLLVNELKDVKLEVQNKDDEIHKLEKEILEFSKTSHSIAHKQKSLEYKLEQLKLSSEISNELELCSTLSHISNECFNNVPSPELSKTNISQLDDMFEFMNSECLKNNIEFQLQLNDNIFGLINNFVDVDSLEILIADHVKNAIIAINSSNNQNRSILVKLGIINDCYGLFVYDSGVEFNFETLINLGKIPSSTHLNSGGSGIGFMNTFDTLKKSNSSLVIYEFNSPCIDNYTKYIAITFDQKCKYKIYSYRKKKIENFIEENNAKNISFSLYNC